MVSTIFTAVSRPVSIRSVYGQYQNASNMLRWGMGLLGDDFHRIKVIEKLKSSKLNNHMVGSWVPSRTIGVYGFGRPVELRRGT